jgi:hypothetical protein
MASRGRPPGREYVVKLEVWVSQRQSDELDAFCEIHLGVKRAEILRRALAAFLKANTGTPAKKAELENAIREVRRRKSSAPIRLRALSGGASAATPTEQEPT